MQPAVSTPRPVVQTPPIVTKPRGLRKILNKLRRTNSVKAPPSQELQTARLSSISCDSLSSSSSSSSFMSWDPETLCKWFDSQGLYMYTAEIMKNVKDGQHLVRICNDAELANKLGIRNVLHQKKICLAVDAFQKRKSDKAGALDHHWALRWLEDIGLPQYKDLFLEARVDGRVLSRLSESDLKELKVTSELHQLSVRCGLRLLRENDWEPSCLKRRSAPGDKRQSGDGMMFWTNQRVMEWLRQISLSEYAPNVRQTGVHGALLCYEPRLSGDLLASILGIPVGRTLMRRHLSFHLQTSREEARLGSPEK